MHAVGRVDVQLLPALAIVDHLVDVGRAEARARIAVLDAALRAADVGVVDDQVRSARPHDGACRKNARS